MQQATFDYVPDENDSKEQPGTAAGAEEKATGTDLIVLPEIDPVKLLASREVMDSALDSLESFVNSIDRDISTEKGKKSVASIAYRISNSKSALEKARLKMSEEYRVRVKAINEIGNHGVARLQKLQDDFRKPLTEFEAREDSRKDAHEAAIKEIAAQAIFPLDGTPLTAADVKERLNALPVLFQRDWEEFGKRATETHESVHGALSRILSDREKAEAEQAELARLRAEAEAREKKEREERIAAEAAAKAKAEAEAAAKAEAERQAKIAEDARLEVIRQKEAAEAKAKADAEAAAKREAEQAAALVKAEEDRKEALAKAERDRLAAIEAAARAERDRIAAEQEAERKAAAAREADKAHRGKINREALDAVREIIMAFKESGNDPSQAIIESIARGKIPHVRIDY